MSEILTIVYSSRATVEEDGQENLDIVKNGARCNAGHGITGFLHREKGLYFHALEGAPDNVDALYERIRQDGRHEDVRRLREERFEGRVFSTWPLGYSSDAETSLCVFCGYDALSASQLRELDGLTVYRFLAKTAFVRRIGEEIRAAEAMAAAE